MDESISRLAWIDWLIIVAFIATSITCGLILSRRGRSSVREYFTSGGRTPWWLLGTSMAATTFAADTPLTLAGWVVTRGIAQNWFWWCQVPVTMLGVFFIARLWRRAALITDNELVYLRYSGTSASVLRGFKALFLSLVYGSIIMGWVNLAMIKIVQLTLPDIPRIRFIDEAVLEIYLHTPISGDLAPQARHAMRSGELDPIALYHEAWALDRQPERVAVMRDLDDIIRRLTVIEARLTAEGVSAIQLQRDSAVADTMDAALRRQLEYARGVDSGSIFLRRLGLEGQDMSMATRWRELGAGPPTLASPPGSLRLLHAVECAVAGVNRLKIILLLFVIVIAYTVIAGLWGVLITDFIQFWVAMAGCIALAVIAVRHLGGMDAVLERLGEIYSVERAQGMISMTPVAGAGDLNLMPLSYFAVFVFFSWYVVQFTDGGSYLAQRMLAARDERHAALGYLWYGVAHYCLRMWPWIVVGVAAAVMFPYTRDAVTGLYPAESRAEEGYVRVMLAVLPHGLLGLVLASFLAAYMSTISTQLNLGASYLLNDFYRPFIKPKASERHYVRVSQAATLLMAAIGLAVSLFYNTIAEAWFFLGTLSAGIGAIYLLRWFWWRINAWSEITCLGALLVYSIVLKIWPDTLGQQAWPYPVNLLYLVPYSVGTALFMTFLTRPVRHEKLVAFVRKVQPGGPGWRRVEASIRETEPGFRCHSTLSWASFRRWVMSVVAIYCFLFGTGKLIFGDVFAPSRTIPARVTGCVLIALGLLLGWFIARTFSATRWDENSDAAQAV